MESKQESQIIINELKSELAHKNRLMEEIQIKSKHMERFAEILAHDLRAPLRNICNLSSIMSVNTLIQEDNILAQKLERIKSISLRLYQSVDAFRTITLGRRDNLVRAEVDICKLIDSIAGEYYSFEPEYRLKAIKKSESSIVLVYPKIVDVLVDNLIKNVISYGERDNPRKLYITVDECKSVVCFSNKIDSSPNEAEDSFNTIALSGSGLGYLICQYVAEIHEGQFWTQIKEGFHNAYFLYRPKEE